MSDDVFITVKLNKALADRLWHTGIAHNAALVPFNSDRFERHIGTDEAFANPAASTVWCENLGEAVMLYSYWDQVTGGNAALVYDLSDGYDWCVIAPGIVIIPIREDTTS